MDATSVEQLQVQDKKISEMSPEEILRLRLINGVHYKIYERNLRPSKACISLHFFKRPEWERNQPIERGYPFTGGAVADSGFIGLYEDFRYVLAYQADVIRQLGTSNKAVIDRLNYIRQIFNQEIDKNQDSYVEKEVEFIDLSGKAKKVVIIFNPFYHIKGGIPSPIPISDRYPVDITIRDPETNQEVTVTELHFGLIKDYGFYESSDKPIENGYIILPQLPVILGLTKKTMAESIQIHDETRTRYMNQWQSEKDQRKSLIKNSPVYKAFADIGKIFPQYLHNKEWMGEIDELIKLYRDLFKSRPGFSDILKMFEEAKQYIIELDLEGINFGDEYTLYMLDEFDHLPNETSEDRRKTFGKSYFYSHTTKP
jgi:hypothetical protein